MMLFRYRFLLLGCALFINSAMTSAQNLVFNGSFEVVDSQCNGSFSPCVGCIIGWRARPGTPDYARGEIVNCSTFGQNSIEGTENLTCYNHYISMWSKNNQDSEGILQLVNFDMGVNYKIELKAKTVDAGGGRSTFVIALTNDLDPNTTCSGGGTIPTQNEILIVGQTTIVNKEWELLTFETGELINNYNTLWIYAKNIDGNDDQQRTHLDDVSAYVDCLDDKYYQNNNQLPIITKTGDFIIAGNNVTGGQTGDVIVEINQNVVFEAANEIVLKPGFQAVQGSVFRASIYDCNSTGFNSGSSSSGRMASDYQLNNSFSTGKIDSLKNNESSSFVTSVYPNPTHQLLNIDYTINSQESVRLFMSDISGKLVQDYGTIKHYESGLHSLRLDVSTLEKGIYFLHLKSSTNEQTFKIYIK
uniref:T9SS type A sorting domain-containing protein n=1 Tax=Fulvivirga sp. TaxID=1931237 RepID=UPI00404ADC2D